MLKNPVLKNPVLKNPVLKNLVLENPVLKNPLHKNDIDTYAYSHTHPEPELLAELIATTCETMGYPEKLSGRLTGRLLKLLVQISGAKKALEIGMFTGYGALSIAEGLPDDGELICCETNPRAIALAKTFFDRSPHGKKINVQFGPAIETLANIKHELDFVFIDADKRNYLNYYQACVNKVACGGLIIIDNALWSGHVLSPRDGKDQVVADLNQAIVNDPRVENILLTVRDGINIVRKI